MNWGTIQSKWHQWHGTLKSEWGRLTDDDLAYIDGNRERMIGKLQERYGYTEEEAAEVLTSWKSFKEFTQDHVILDRTEKGA